MCPRDALHVLGRDHRKGERQPFQLVMVGGFMESEPVQARLILSHDGLGQACDAAFRKHLGYDLSPIIRLYREHYGERGKIVLRLVDWHGEVHSFELEV